MRSASGAAAGDPNSGTTMDSIQYPSAPAQIPRPNWAWKAGLVLDTPSLAEEISSAIAEGGAARAFELPASSSPFEVATVVHREKPDVLFVELARTSRPAAQWIADVRPSDDLPLIIAVHPAAEPAEMISALRAGASEFLYLPVRPAIYEAMERVGSLLEARRSANIESGRIAGILSAKGGCGATSVACHLSAALQHLSDHPAVRPAGPGPAPTRHMRVLVVDLDCQTPGGSGVFRASPRAHAGDAFDAVRRLSSNSWRDLVSSVLPGIDLLASPADVLGPVSGEVALPEQWRVESLFRFLTRQYDWILVDLGRHLNPTNWALLQNVEELLIVTAPDVLALYQTRTVLQTLSSRGFEKNRIHIVLNRNQSTPRDFWVESIEQMFEMTVFGVLPNDEATLNKLPGDRFEFPADSPFGRAMIKMAARMAAAPGGMQPQGKAA